MCGGWEDVKVSGGSIFNLSNRKKKTDKELRLKDYPVSAFKAREKEVVFRHLSSASPDSFPFPTRWRVSPFGRQLNSLSMVSRPKVSLLMPDPFSFSFVECRAKGKKKEREEISIG